MILHHAINAICFLSFAFVTEATAVGNKDKQEARLTQIHNAFQSFQQHRDPKSMALLHHRHLIVELQEMCTKLAVGTEIIATCFAYDDTLAEDPEYEGYGRMSMCMMDSEDPNGACTYTLYDSAAMQSNLENLDFTQGLQDFSQIFNFECAGCTNGVPDCSNIDPDYTGNACTAETNLSFSCNEDGTCCDFSIAGVPDEPAMGVSCCTKNSKNECCVSVEGEEDICSSTTIDCPAGTAPEDCTCDITLGSTACSSCSFCPAMEISAGLLGGTDLQPPPGIQFNCNNVFDGWEQTCQAQDMEQGASLLSQMNPNSISGATDKIQNMFFPGIQGDPVAISDLRNLDNTEDPDDSSASRVVPATLLVFFAMFLI